jgi:hypothetical protein
MGQIEGLPVITQSSTALARAFSRPRGARERTILQWNRHVGRMMRENFSTGSAPFRKAYLQSLDLIEVNL